MYWLVHIVLPPIGLMPAWMHLYSKGGHGYGLRDTGVAVNEWPDRAEDWFREIGVIE